MKIKTRICTLITAMALLLTPTMAYAADTTDGFLLKSYEGELTVIPDENTPPQVAYGGYAPAIPHNALTRAGGPTYHWGAKVGLYNGTCYSESWNSDKTVKYPIDEIMASVNVYANGKFEGDNTDIRYYSYTAKAASHDGAAFSFVVGREAYGSHLFKHSGYNTMEQDSYAKA